MLNRSLQIANQFDESLQGCFSFFFIFLIFVGFDVMEGERSARCEACGAACRCVGAIVLNFSRTFARGMILRLPPGKI